MFTFKIMRGVVILQIILNEHDTINNRFEDHYFKCLQF